METIYEMLHIFRNWNRDWDIFMKSKPESVDKLVKELSKQYTITKRINITNSLDKTLTIKQMLKSALNNLDLADMWNSIPDILESLKTEQVTGFRSQAFGIIFMLYSTFGENDKRIEYRGLTIPESWVAYLEKVKHEIDAK